MESSHAISSMQRFAAFLMTLGPGAGAGFYTAMGAYYIEKFNSPSFFTAMLLCFVAPQPIVSFLQQTFDAFFDEQLSTRLTYFYRVILAQLVLAMICLVWMFAPEKEWIVLSIGVSLGLIVSSTVSSALQMVSAIEPRHIIMSKIGLQVGGVLPMILFSCTGFQPSSSRQDFRNVVNSVVWTSCVAAGVLAYFHITTDLFTQAYKRLSYDTRLEENCFITDGRTPEEGQGLLEEDQKFERLALIGTESVVLDRAACKDGPPDWLPYWQFCHAVVQGIAMCLVSTAGFAGNTSSTQFLTLLKLTMDCIGRILSIGIPYVPAFVEGPWHTVLGGCVGLVVILSSVILARFYDILIPIVPFTISWCVVFLVIIFAGSLIDVTTGAYVETVDRKAVARTNQFSLVSGVFVGLLVGRLAGQLMPHHDPLTLQMFQ